MGKERAYQKSFFVIIAFAAQLFANISFSQSAEPDKYWLLTGDIREIRELIHAQDLKVVQWTSPDSCWVRLNKTGAINIDSKVRSKNLKSPFTHGTYLVSYLDGFDLYSEGYLVLKDKPEFGSGIVYLRDRSSLQKLLDNPSIKYISKAEGVMEEGFVDDHDLSFNRINFMQNSWEAQPVTISIKENLFDTLDIDLVKRFRVVGIESDRISQHATSMATIIGGQGNSSINGKGVLTSSTLIPSSFDELLPDDTNILAENLINIQNHSYGTAVPSSNYEVEARAYDLQSNQVPELLHIWSAGNLGSSDKTTGPYVGIPKYGTVSGDMKSGKNGLVISALDKEIGTLDLNSAGPTFDGRIKPELVALGASGTSESAALVSGLAGYLQGEIEKRTGSLPESSLVKAILIASAEDVGKAGIDWETGYGNINARRSISVVENDNYWTDSFVDQAKTFPINVPSGVKEIRLVLVWNDPAANAGTAVSLVNDLDIEITELNNGNITLPWTLNSYPDLDSLNLPAIRGLDITNNVELITLEYPNSGDYEIKVNGILIENPTQTFSIAVHFEYLDEFEFTTPVSGEVLQGGKTNRIRWDSNLDALGELEISYDGILWESTAIVDTRSRYYDLPLADTIVSAQLRLVAGGINYISDDFLISSDTRSSIGYVCDEEVMISWKEIPGATTYHISLFNGESFIDLADASDTLYISTEDILNGYIRIDPATGNSRSTMSPSVLIETQFAGCFYNTFTTQVINNETVLAKLALGTLYNVSSISLLRSEDGEEFSSVETILPGKALEYEFNDLAPFGEFSYYQMEIELQDGNRIFTEINRVFVPAPETFIIYPNPILQGSYFTLLSKPSTRTLSLFTLHGGLVKTWKVLSEFSEFDLPEIEKGIYILKISDQTGFTRTRRIMVR